MGRLQQPLLAEESNEQLPSLSGPSSVEEEDSPLSRLIAESTPQEALLPYEPANDETLDGYNNRTASNSQAASFTTILAGTLIVLCWGFTWGAFFSNSWMDSHLNILVGWQLKYLPWLDNHTDLVIQESSVFTLSSDLNDDKEYFSLLGLWICSIILPCVFMIVCPIWILTDFQLPRHHLKQMAESQPPRAWLELSVRLSLLVVFILLFLNVAITGIELEWQGTNLKLYNQLRGPYISFLLGCTCALLSVVVLRMPFLEHLHLCRYPSSESQRARTNNNVSSQSSDSVPPSPAAYAPPARAFRLPWLSSSDGMDPAAAAETNETEPMLGSQQQQQQRGSQDAAPQQSSPPSSVSFWHQFVIFQLGLLSLILWFPVMALGQFRVLYGGLVVDLVKNKAFNVYLWQIPKIVWHSGINGGTPKWMLVLVFCLLFLLALVLPVLAHLVATMTWIRRGRSRLWWRDALKLLQPTICGVPFAIALLVTVGSFIDIGENLDSAICQKIESVVQNQCLITGGVRLAGSWFTLAQAVFLEFFVLLTLRWTGPKKPQHSVV